MANGPRDAARLEQHEHRHGKTPGARHGEKARDAVGVLQPCRKRQNEARAHGRRGVVERDGVAAMQRQAVRADADEQRECRAAASARP